MKKLLFLVLFILVLTSISEDLTDEWNIVKKVVKDAVQWLKDKGVYQKLIEFLTKNGEVAAVEICSKKLPKSLCEDIVSWLVDAIKNNLIKN